MLENTYCGIHISLDSDTTLMISNGNFLHYWFFLSKKMYHLLPNLCYVKTNFSILHLIMSLSAHWFHKYYRSNFNYFLNISKTSFLITFLMKIYNWLVFAYHFPLHVLLFFSKRIAWNVQKLWLSKAKQKKTTKNTHKIYFCILIFNLKFCFLSLSIFFNIRNDIINIDPFRRGQ